MIVQDGAPELWAQMDERCARHEWAPAACLVDWFHVVEHLAAALALITVDKSAADRLHAKCCVVPTRGDRAIDRISRFLDELQFLLGWGAGEDPFPRRLRGTIRPHVAPAMMREFTRHADSIARHKHRMRYASARSRGYTIGSGITEGACKSVVTMRCKRSGQRWFTTGLAACLTLRTRSSSDRLEPTFARAQALWTREIRPA